MIKIGVIGGAGYTAGELIRLLINHPAAEIVFIQSKSNPGKKITSIHGGLYGECDLLFSHDAPLTEIDLLFFCTAHGDTKKFIEAHELPKGLKVIDLSMDYRLSDSQHPFIYGLPELHRDAIRSATAIANPGCFATAIQLALLPLAAKKRLDQTIHIHAITGSTGAGVKPVETTHFSWRNDNISVYKPFTHQHLAEITQTLTTLQPDFGHELLLIPLRGCFARGIFATLHFATSLPIEEARALYEAYYADHPFTFVTETSPDMKQAVNTNKALIHLQKEGDTLLITTTIDNLLKGASGQAVQNMNLMFNLEETTGLHLKANAF